MSSFRHLTRRSFVLALAASAAACQHQAATVPEEVDNDDDWYIGSMPDKPYDIPLVDRSKMKPELARQTVAYTGGEKPGTIVVDIDQRFLFLVQPGDTAIRYGIGVGRQGFSWRGMAYVGRKAVWPDWRPTATMKRILKNLPDHMEGGLNSPLGARALYLYQNGHDILFRIHGTNEPWSIGEQVSSGCIRLLNEDIYDLYNRVDVGTTVIVKKNGRLRT
ncbi:L,D-transpeptidase [Rhizobiales bacterium TNE-4]|nr:L,D-transpeptidase [Rhizobiales bacterium TNE-4]MBV1826528.1 L,D-transpeptidase [Rhizobiales bacterium TNE-4]